MAVAIRTANFRCAAGLLACLVISVGIPWPAHALIDGCPGDASAAGDKVVVGSVTELAGEVSNRLWRAMLAAFEMRFEQAKADLHDEARIVYCEGRTVRESGSYNAGVVSVLNDEEVLLEVGARKDGDDIMVTYVVIPIRHYAHFGGSADAAEGYHRAIYEQSRVSAGLHQLFRGNAELRLMAALALALRHEKTAEATSDAGQRRILIDRSRAFYCDAVGSLEAARPRPDFLGLPKAEWEALDNFARAGAARLFEMAKSDQDYAGALSVVASERAGAADGRSACVLLSGSDPDTQ